MKYTDPRGLIWEVFQQIPNPFLFFGQTTSASTNVPLSFSVLGLLSGPNTTSPWDLGFQWLTGNGPRSQTFRDGDPMAELLKQHRHIQSVAEEACAGAIPQEDSAPYNLSGIEGVPKYLRDYSTLMTGGLTGNLAVTYLGSYNLSYSVANGVVRMGVTNTSSAASGLRSHQEVCKQPQAAAS